MLFPDTKDHLSSSKSNRKMKLEVLNIQGESTGRSVDLSDAIFGIEPNEHAVYLAVKQYLAAQRQGTHKAKEKNEVSYSTRKIKKQKGTGTARAGSVKSPVFRHGGRVFGPRPRSYDFKLNKKVKRLATISALSSKAKEGRILVVEDFTFEQPKTKAFMNVLNAVKADNRKSLLVLPEYDRSLYLSGRNLPGSEVVEAANLNTYEIVNSNTIVFSESAIKKLEDRVNA